MKNATLFSIALKNLRRHRRRTIINVLSIAISVGILVFFIGYYRGTYIVMMREAYIRFKTAHIQVQRPAFDEKKPQNFVTPETVITDYSPVLSKIAASRNVTAVSERLTGMGFVGNGMEKMAVSIVGADPAADRNITVVDEYITAGSYLDAADGVLIGTRTAALFDLKVGDLCYLQAQTVNNAPNIVTLPVTGIYATGFYELDKNTVFLSRANAQALFDTGDAVNKIMVFLTDMDLAEKKTNELRSVLGPGFNVQPWQFYSQAILENERGDGIFYLTFLLILVFISITTIMGTMYVNVYERTREIGTLRAIGWTQNEVFRLFIAETAAIGVIGSCAGLILGGIPTAYLALVGIDASEVSGLVALPVLRWISDPKIYDFAAGFLMGVLATYLGGLLPARKASRMIVTDALRVT